MVIIDVVIGMMMAIMIVRQDYYFFALPGYMTPPNPPARTRR